MSARMSLFKVLVLLLACLPILVLAEDQAESEWLESARSQQAQLAQALDVADTDEQRQMATRQILRTLAPMRSRLQKQIQAQEKERTRVAELMANLGEFAEAEVPELTQARDQLRKQLNEVDLRLVEQRALLQDLEQTFDRAEAQDKAWMAERLLAPGPTFLSVLGSSLNDTAGWQTTFETAWTKLKSTVDKATQTQWWLWFGLLMVVVLSVQLRHRWQVQSRNFDESQWRRFGTVLWHNLRNYLPGVLGLSVFGLFSWVQFGDHFISLLPLGLAVLLSGDGLLTVLFRAQAPTKALLNLDADLASALHTRLRGLWWLGGVGGLLLMGMTAGVLTEPQYQLLRSGWILLFAFNLGWAVWLLGALPSLSLGGRVRSVLLIALVLVLGAEALGYRNLADYVLLGSLSTVLGLIVAALLAYSMTDMADALDEGRAGWPLRLRSNLSVTEGERIPGMMWLRLIFSVLIWGGFLLWLLWAWGFVDTGLGRLQSTLLVGFEIGALQIVPIDIVLGIVLFVGLLSAVRWLRYTAMPRWLTRSRMDKGAKEAVITLTGYAAAILAFLLALTMVGIDFTHLAVIAGALSVGIGFGLQNVVNNFVSGLILLFERPIRVGDWIVVGGVEGYVRRISIRSTLIQTFDRADVIVPNSELISSQVTNWVLRDPWGRVVVPITVAYGSDTELVKTLLLKIAKEHPAAMTDGVITSPPKVMFIGFGDSALMFELRLFIHDVDQRMNVKSDINFAIDKAFRENDIEIPFPQRVVHLKNE